jgi:hypothetical protein
MIRRNPTVNKYGSETRSAGRKALCTRLSCRLFDCGARHRISQIQSLGEAIEFVDASTILCCSASRMILCAELRGSSVSPTLRPLLPPAPARPVAVQPNTAPPAADFVDISPSFRTYHFASVVCDSVMMNPINLKLLTRRGSIINQKTSIPHPDHMQSFLARLRWDWRASIVAAPELARPM